MDIAFRRQKGEPVLDQFKQKAIEYLHKVQPTRGSHPPKLYRKSAYHILCALDSMLLFASGRGVSDFRAMGASVGSSSSSSSASTHAPGQSPDFGLTLCLCVDQGSDGWAAAMWLLYVASVRLLLFFDPSHRNWNDLKMAISSAGLWDAVLLWGVVFSVNYGPFESAGWWMQAKEAAKDYSDHSSVDCPLLQALLPRIAKESGCPERLGDPGYAQEVLDTLWAQRAFLQKGPKLALARWLSWMHCWSFWERQMGIRLLGLLYLGINLGYLDHRPASSQLSLQAMRPPDEHGVLGSTRQSARLAVRSVRDRCKNMLHVATLVLADSALVRKGSILDVLSRGVRKWHSDQVSENTSPSANVGFYRSQATGQFWPALAHAFEAVRDVERLADMGFCTRCPLGMKGKLAADHPLVLEENTWAALAMRFCFALLLHRWASLLWHVQALPGRFAALVDPSADIREAALAFIKECWQVWLEADKRTEKQVRSWCKRSWFQCVAVREVCEELAKVGFEYVPADVAAHLLEAFSTPPTSLCEHGFKFVRKAEDRDADHKTMSSSRIWLAPMHAQVMTSRHNYTEVEWRKQAVTSSDPRTLPPSIFKPCLQRQHTSFDMSGIVSKDSPPPWPSLSPASFFGLAGEMAAMRFCSQAKCWGQAETVWMCGLLRPGMLVRRVGDLNWTFSCGPLEGLDHNDMS